MPADPTLDHAFLRALVQALDDNPSGRISAEDITPSVGLGDDDVEATVQRLKARGLLEFAKGPRLMSDGWTNTPLSVTPAGYTAAGA